MYTYRHLEANCRATLRAGKILVLLGARQTGKSTLARHLVADLPETGRLFLNLDDPFLRDRLIGTEGALQAEIENRAGRPYSSLQHFHLVLDEAQKAPALFERIKALYDADRDRICFILTGSSALAIHDPVAETLAGRARIHHLWPFTLSEGFAHVRGVSPAEDPLPELISRLLRGLFSQEDFMSLVERGRWHAGERRRWVRQHLRFPLFPEPSTLEEPELWIRDYLATYLEKDIQSLAAVGNLALFRAAIRQIAARVGSTMKWETAAQEIGTTSVTLRKYAGLMEETLNLERLTPFAANPVKRVIKAPKLYLIDNGLLWGLRGYEDERLLERTGMLGIYAEQAAIVELAKWCALEPTAPELRFWAKSSAAEVDLVISNRGYHIPFEIKLGRTLDRRWSRGLDAFEADHQGLGIEIPYRIILHHGEPEQLDGRTYALPLWLFA